MLRSTSARLRRHPNPPLMDIGATAFTPAPCLPVQKTPLLGGRVVRRRKHVLIHTPRGRGPSSTSSLRMQQQKQQKQQQRQRESGQAIDPALQSVAAAASVAMEAAMKSDISSAPSTSTKSYISRDLSMNAPTDPEGLPLVYDRIAIEKYWRSSRGALQSRWTEFIATTFPLLSRCVGLLLRGGTQALSDNAGSLANDLRTVAEKLGPTYVKGAQMLSTRPDVLPTEALEPLSHLQDAVEPFDNATAMAILKQQLECEVDQVFDRISDHPIAAASLAQVYKARLRSSGEWVAVKVQRPDVRALVSKDLYVLRRAAGVYQRVMERLTPQQKTDYVALLDEWAVGLYTELDFCNEMRNQQLLKEQLSEVDGVVGTEVYVPRVFEEFCRRRVLVSEWVDGVKLSECSDEDIRELTLVGQEAFLTQLLDLGVFHADPHPGNLLKLTGRSREKGRLALLDFGLVAKVEREDRDRMVSAVIHLANKDYRMLVDDLIALDVLPNDCDRRLVLPLMDKALSPYVKGGGVREYEKEVRRMYGMNKSDDDDNEEVSSGGGGFAAMTRDAVTVLTKVPFSIPPYFALLGRAIITLEGLALQGDPNYGIIRSAYPYVARTLLQDSRPVLRQALHDVVDGNDGDDLGRRARRLRRLLRAALSDEDVHGHGEAGGTGEGMFVDLDEEDVGGEEGDDSEELRKLVKMVAGSGGDSVRNLLEEELIEMTDVLARNGLRKWLGRLEESVLSSLSPSSLPLPFQLPFPLSLPLPFPQLPSLLPRLSESTTTLPWTLPTAQQGGTGVRVVWKRPGDMVNILLPSLSPSESVYISAATELLLRGGSVGAAIVSGELKWDKLWTIVGDMMLGLFQRRRGLAGVATATTGDLVDLVASAAQDARLLDDDLRHVWLSLSADEQSVLRDSASRILRHVSTRFVERCDSL